MRGQSTFKNNTDAEVLDVASDIQTVFPCGEAERLKYWTRKGKIIIPTVLRARLASVLRRVTTESSDTVSVRPVRFHSEDPQRPSHDVQDYS